MQLNAVQTLNVSWWNCHISEILFLQIVRTLIIRWNSGKSARNYSEIGIYWKTIFIMWPDEKPIRKWNLLEFSFPFKWTSISPYLGRKGLFQITSQCWCFAFTCAIVQFQNMHASVHRECQDHFFSFMPFHSSTTLWCTLCNIVILSS